MILELNGTKVTIVDKTLGYQGDNLVNTIQVTVDKDSTWNYKLDMYKGKSKCFDSVLMTREGNVCTVQLTNEILSYGGRYIFQLRGYTDTQTYHSDIFESWVNASIEYQYDCKQADCECDCKLPTEFYQVEDNVTEINNHPPYPGDNNKWMIWDVNKHEYVESDIEVIAGGGDYQTKDNLTTSITAESTDEQYPSAKATYEYGQSIAESAGKINAITVNGTAQTVEDKTAKIIVNKSTVGLGNVNNTSDNDKPVSSAQASAIADAKQAGTTAQANLDAHISNKENPHEVTKTQVGLGNVDNTSDVNKPISTATQTALNGKLDKTAVVDVTVEALKGQAADAKSVYDAIQAAKPDIVTPSADSTDTQAASAKAVWDMLGGGATGTDISLGITGASVGDIIKVKAVDDSGKPTAWEAARIGETWELLYQTTLTEAVAKVSYSLLDAPCRKVGAIIETPAVEADTSYSYFNCETNVSAPGGHTAFSFSPKAIPRKEKYHEVFWGEIVKIGEDNYANVTCIHGNEFYFPWDGTSNTNPGHDTTMCGVFKKTIDPYGNPLGDKIISVSMTTYATFPVGTNITFFGVRA